MEAAVRPAPSPPPPFWELGSCVRHPGGLPGPFLLPVIPACSLQPARPPLPCAEPVPAFGQSGPRGQPRSLYLVRFPTSW